jgi:hypothetical protein
VTPRARELLLHPIALAAIAVLVINDHWLKSAHPSWVTGKLSDAAGLAFFPLLLLVIARVPPTVSNALVAALATAAVFTLVKTVPAATDVYRHVLGVLQWPITGSTAPVEAVTDPTDVACVPFAALAVAITATAASTCRPAAARWHPR